MDDRFQTNRPIDEQPQGQPRGVRIAILASALILPLTLTIALKPAAARAAWEQIASIIQLKSDLLPASPAKFSEHLNEGLSSMGPQRQAELLLEQSINHSEGAIEQLSSHMDSWRGQLKLNPHLSGLLDTALNSDDLRVRAAGIEMELAVYNLPKSPESAQGLIQRIESDPAARPWALWMLGAIGNRGVEAGSPPTPHSRTHATRMKKRATGRSKAFRFSAATPPSSPCSIFSATISRCRCASGLHADWLNPACSRKISASPLF